MALCSFLSALSERLHLCLVYFLVNWILRNVEQDMYIKQQLLIFLTIANTVKDRWELQPNRTYVHISLTSIPTKNVLIQSLT